MQYRAARLLGVCSSLQMKCSFLQLAEEEAWGTDGTCNLCWIQCISARVIADVLARQEALMSNAGVSCPSPQS